MPLELAHDAPTILVRREAFERAGLARSEIDAMLNLTPDEFRVEGALIAIGPLWGDDAAGELADWLEERGLAPYDDFFDMSGSVPNWLTLYAMATRTGARPASPPA
jgi:hypothetical protein